MPGASDAAAAAAAAATTTTATDHPPAAGKAGASTAAQTTTAGAKAHRKPAAAVEGAAAAAVAPQDVQVPLRGVSGAVHGAALCPGASRRPLFVSVGKLGLSEVGSGWGRVGEGGRSLAELRYAASSDPGGLLASLLLCR